MEIVLLFTFFVALRFLFRPPEKHADVDPYEWLEVVSFTVWKSGEDIRDEMRKLKGCPIDSSKMLAAFMWLEANHLVEKRPSNEEVKSEETEDLPDQIKLYEFRRPSKWRPTQPEPVQSPYPSLIPEFA
ncbi:MAG: hypothetical protein A2664_01180 [Candidatus Taylorbacteria bacterium RIFCSPHIGHO2_01_FULL_46_22b]|uniref:Uncharacterized protein n=1 Tax=Candidatus Taylorbacteria bacterium RIFCSPHIGHO2_01_FULL_46_22b TaxID=1802301 RepID=A0A1G2M225_9BACT|nr:MAG: hypothetical protein A2664_01180 [Candidatus Taylorbacteria bacterium RIFCSPHIGHO2_01_FULL_46_22b]